MFLSTTYMAAAYILGMYQQGRRSHGGSFPRCPLLAGVRAWGQPCAPRISESCYNYDILIYFLFNLFNCRSYILYCPANPVNKPRTLTVYFCQRCVRSKARTAWGLSIIYLFRDSVPAALGDLRRPCVSARVSKVRVNQAKSFSLYELWYAYNHTSTFI